MRIAAVLVTSGLALVAALPVTPAAGAPPVQSVEDIAAAARAEALRQALPSTEGLKVEETRVDDRLRLPRCREPLAARAAPGNRVVGRTTIEVSCRTPEWRVFVPVSLALRMPVVVAARPLPVGQALEATDLALAERDVHALTRGYYRRIEDALGRSVSRPLGAGEALTPAALRAGTVVRRGQQVILLARTAGLAVRMNGEALADGGISQRIRVRNLASGREVEGVVRSAELVEVGM